MTEEEILRLRARHERILSALLAQAMTDEISEVQQVGLRGIRPERWIAAVRAAWDAAASDAHTAELEILLSTKQLPDGSDASDAVRRIVARAEALAERHAALLRDALAAGLSPADAAAVAYGQVGPGLPRDAAQIIVEAISWGQQQGAISSGRSLLQQWNNVGDDLVRDAHRRVADVPVGVPFQVGGEPLDFPGDSSASIHLWINCRCYVTFQELVSTAPPGSPAAEFLARR